VNLWVCEGLGHLAFAEDIGPITHLKVGPDGYLYATILGYGDGKIVRILPQNEGSM
jgi:hypothetical protein